MGDRSKNFSNAEFACNCRVRAPHLPKCKHILPPDALIDVVQDVRDHFGKPVTINSGYRCPPYNAHVKGAKASQHMKGDAADITVDGVTPDQVQEYLLAKYKGRYGIGRYNTFTHVDVRGYEARWDNRR